MAKAKKYGNRIDADFSEDTVGFALESFLATLAFPRQRFSIEPFSRTSERWLGADGRLLGSIRNFKPFYMQFKRPFAYPDFAGSHIIKDRKALGLEVSPRVLFFNLQKKMPSHYNFQHNVLFCLRRRLKAKGIGDAAYVCPLFLDRSAYRFHVQAAGLRRWFRFWQSDPWELESVLLNAGGNAVQFDRIPVLAEHISIPPHAIVANANHRYSFTDNGKNVCFHSPLALPELAQSLATFLKEISRGFLAGDSVVRIETAADTLKSLFDASDKADPLMPRGLIDEQSPIGGWLEWGAYLKQEFQIEQYAFISWAD